jgi:hypothetical protein
LRKPDTADDDSQHVVEVVRDAARKLADRFHLLHLPDLQLGGFAFGDGVSERDIRAGKLSRRLAGMRDPNGKGTDRCGQAGDDGNDKKGNGSLGRRDPYFQ